MIKLDKINLHIDTKHQKLKILNNIDLEIKKGSFIIITGVSGSGKSSLINILAGLDKPTSGTYFFNNININNNKERLNVRRNLISLIVQNYALVNDINVKDNLQINPKPTDINYLYELCEYLDIENYLDTKVKYLSGGQKQRVAIARALLKDSELILADEPTGALDKTNKDKTIKILRDINKRYEKSIVIVTHDIELLNENDIHYHMEDGYLKRLIDDV